ncbi:MAG: SAM-dependent methyltransferase, partial [Rhodospirillaceae bacterium]
MAGLIDIIRRQILLQGPMTVAQYMEFCLAHPEHGYYRKRDPLGVAGDFTTAPEISQMFGELLGLWAGVVWQGMGEPNPVRLVELGPGRGTLMADARRAARMVPGFADALRVHLVETSPVLRARQAATLADADPAWHGTDADIPPGPAIVFANEFLDALPVRQFQRGAAGWRERLVGLTADGERLEFVLSPPQPINPLLPDSRKTAAPGAIVEVSPAVLNIAGRLGARIVRDGGAALIVDYGGAGGATLQAVRDQKYWDPLAAPGDADLTAHVDFAMLTAALKATGAR